MTNLSPKRRGTVAGNGFVLTWKPKKHMERYTGLLHGNQTPVVNVINSYVGNVDYNKLEKMFLWIEPTQKCTAKLIYSNNILLNCFLF